MCNLAAWRNKDKDGSTYLSVELSPWYKPRAQSKANKDIIEDLFDDQGD
jgi:hypothetical protein